MMFVIWGSAAVGPLSIIWGDETNVSHVCVVVVPLHLPVFFCLCVAFKITSFISVFDSKSILPFYAFRWLDSSDLPLRPYVQHPLSSFSTLFLWLVFFILLNSLMFCHLCHIFPLYHPSSLGPVWLKHLMAILCHYSGRQSWFPADIRSVFCQLVREPQRVLCLQRSTRSVKPRKSNLHALFSFSFYSITLQLIIKRMKSGILALMCFCLSGGRRGIPWSCFTGAHY